MKKSVMTLLLASASAFSLLASHTNREVRESTVKAVAYNVKVLEVLPHDVNAYTQGLFFHKGRLFESSGQYGQSFFREVDIKTGRSLRSFNLLPKYFAEGSVVMNDKIYLLTWMEREVLIYDLITFKQLGTLYNPREGWGLTTDGDYLIASDGSATIFYHHPATFREIKRLEVTLNGKPIKEINELEYIDGLIWANIYGSDMIVIIDPLDGKVRATINCKNLLPHSLRTSRTDVLNGIAYNKETGSIYITGKYWPKMFRIENLLKKR